MYNLILPKSPLSRPSSSSVLGSYTESKLWFGIIYLMKINIYDFHAISSKLYLAFSIHEGTGTLNCIKDIYCRFYIDSFIIQLTIYYMHTTEHLY